MDGARGAKTPLSDEAQLSLIKELLPKMVGLRAVHIEVIHLSRGVYGRLPRDGSKIPTRSHLGYKYIPIWHMYEA